MTERIPPENREKEGIDDISKEAHEMYMEHQVDRVQEALHIQQAEDLIMQYVEKGDLAFDMRLGDMLEQLNEKKVELIGDGEDTDQEENE